ncbi:DNA dC-_dU-editing enzyme APOBEC-3F, partial [Galemys pyrenaicus]
GLPEVKNHPERQFLSWFKNYWSPHKYYHVTWFISWSPCVRCARSVADFLEKYRNVQLSVFAARLYYHWEPEYQEGLRGLCRCGAQVDIMSLQREAGAGEGPDGPGGLGCPGNFSDCWKNFVHNRGSDFRPWNDLQKNYDSLVTILQHIFG